jgi:hypothetical protein
MSSVMVIHLAPMGNATKVEKGFESAITPYLFFVIWLKRF